MKVKLIDAIENELSIRNKSLADIEYVNCRDYSITVEEFKQLAEEEYEDGIFSEDYKSLDVSLALVGKDFWFDRSLAGDFWIYHEKPKKYPHRLIPSLLE